MAATAKTQTQASKPSTPSNPPGSPRQVRPGFVSHAELASKDPAATKAWAQKVLGWQFGDPMPTPDGPYHMWRHQEQTGGGIRKTNAQESPGTIPYVEVTDIQAAFANAKKAGATEMVPIMDVPDGTKIGVVQAPGGVPIGFWAPK